MSGPQDPPGNGQPQRVVLTGPGRGIGHATVKRFSDEGWEVITCSRDEVPADCRRDPNWTRHITADLAEPEQLARFVAEAKAIIGDGPVHALVNNAAVSPKRSEEHTSELQSLMRISYAVFCLKK